MNILAEIRRFRYDLRVGRQFRKHYESFAAGNDGRLTARWQDRLPLLGNHAANMLPPSDYLLHLGWAARRLREAKPIHHVDISSSTYFAAIISAFVPVTYYEYRNREITLPGLECREGSLLSLPMPDNSQQSISSMHVVEHIGLGRYGDPIDPAADLKAMRELQRVCAPGGRLYFVTPVGRPRIVFDAHRIYSLEHIVSSFPQMELESHAVKLDGVESLQLDVSADVINAQEYGCGCFVFRKKEQVGGS